jgi:RNA polymerase sigma-70 factor (ECF subfamily)
VPDRIDAQRTSSQAGPLAPATAERLDRLFRRYNTRLLAFAATRTRDHATAEDVVSETWLRAAVSLPQLRADDDRAYGWLRAIAVRAAVDHYRPKRASERPTDWADGFNEAKLPVTRAAEDVALAELLGGPQQPAPAPPAPAPFPLPVRRPGATNPPKRARDLVLGGAR